LAFLILINGAFSGTEVALISLREGQLQRIEDRSGTGRVLARLARDPNRFLATIQIGITLAGFLASAFAAVTVAEPLVPRLGFLGSAAEPVAIVGVTAILAFITLVIGELAPKRVAMQRAERWGLLAARPLDGLSRIMAPLIWLLGRTTDLVVRLIGVDPSVHRDRVSEQELVDLVATHTGFSSEHRTILSEAFEIGDRTLQQVLVPRREVFTLSEELTSAEAVQLLAASGHSRAPVVGGGLDHVRGVATLRTLVAADGPLVEHVDSVLELPESLVIIDALRALQKERQQLAMVVNEHGGVDGIVTLEDLIEELVGEIYDETDTDLMSVVHEADGSILVPGSFPIHDLPDLTIDVPEGEYTTVAGLILEGLGDLPEAPGASIEVARRRFEVVEVKGLTIARVRIHGPTAADGPEPTVD
jgi:putative hemolysin